MAAWLNQNMNVLWASVLVEELCRNGLDTFFVSPGNRNAPLAAALAHNAQAKIFSCMDERGAAYRALGFAKATGKPGVVVCTSGTALANYYPAVIEAFRDTLPLVVLSADRPPELAGSDANQTIMQEGIYAHYCLESLNLPCPDPAYPLVALAAKICHIARVKEGPAHINCRFRDPLIPAQAPSGPVQESVLSEAGHYFEKTGPATVHAPVSRTCPDLAAIKDILKKTRRGLLVIGRLENSEDREGAKTLASMLGWPVFCDVASALKGTAGDLELFALDHPRCVSLIKDYNPDTILQLGTGLVSKHYYAAILQGDAQHVIQVSPRQGHRDPSFRVSMKVKAGAGDFFRSLGDSSRISQDKSAALVLIDSLQQVESDIKQATPKDVLSFPLIADIINRRIPAGEALFPGNSNTIRAFDMAEPPANRGVQVVTNRGVSGIEGNVATSLGFSEGLGRRVTAVMGDVSLLHDLNSLAMLADSRASVIVVVVNNQGGRIFERLPIQDFPEIANPMMTTPHGFAFYHAAHMFNLPYAKAATPGELETAYGEALGRDGSQIIEAALDPEKDLEIFKIRRNI
ncbi:MAG: 2-succinyl-5-enolpyruvyl-6-hydroxy-3-cyclohexene-1-carboxylic-acid synthase [Desulfatibacillum sp.]|nr:2-succinyl-5-enolpyruvyl-6-hydroxy-3-cyclohexene-1-carboxylic-acid synthase [Desulfatibacillum sp.]